MSWLSILVKRSSTPVPDRADVSAYIPLIFYHKITLLWQDTPSRVQKLTICRPKGLFYCPLYLSEYLPMRCSRPPSSSIPRLPKSADFSSQILGWLHRHLESRDLAYLCNSLKSKLWTSPLQLYPRSYLLKTYVEFVWIIFFKDYLAKESCTEGGFWILFEPTHDVPVDDWAFSYRSIS